MPALRVMTWNILHETACEEEREHPWSKRRAGARQLVERARPDVLCLQEAHASQVDYLLENLPHHWWFGKDRQGGNEGEGCPIAYDTTRFRRVDWKQFWLGTDPDTPASLTWVNDVPRVVVVATFEDHATRRRFHVANTHMDHLVPTSRTKAIDLLQERLPEGTMEEPLILAGDFNSPAWTKPHRLLMRGPRRFHDTFRTRHRGPSMVSGTFHKFKGRGLARVDWILTRPRLETTDLQILRDRPGGVYPSDHFPVVADIVLPDGAARGRGHAHGAGAAEA